MRPKLLGPPLGVCELRLELRPVGILPVQLPDSMPEAPCEPLALLEGAEEAHRILLSGGTFDGGRGGRGLAEPSPQNGDRESYRRYGSQDHLEQRVGPPGL